MNSHLIQNVKSSKIWLKPHPLFPVSSSFFFKLLPIFPEGYKLLKSFSLLCLHIKMEYKLQHKCVKFTNGQMAAFGPHSGWKLTLTSSRSLMATWGCQSFHFLPLWHRKTTTRTKNCFCHWENDKCNGAKY